MQREPRNAPSSTITGAACGGSSTPPIPTPPARWTSAPICAHEPDRRPGVDHRARADPGADVDVARHQHDALGEKRAVARDPGRHDPDAERRVDALDRDLVEEPEPADLHRLDLPQPEVEEDRLLHPLVDDPAAVDRLGDPDLAAVEQLDRLLDRRRRRARRSPTSSSIRSRRRHQRTSSRIAAARAHSSSRRDERVAHVALAGRPEVRAGRDDDAVLEQPRRVLLRGLAVGHRDPEVHRRRAAGVAKALAARGRRAAARACAGRRRGRASTCSSSPQATTEARWTNSCGAVPTFGRNRRSASISAGSPATKPLRKPVIDERFESVLNATTFVQSSSWSAEGGGSSNQSSLYASSEARTKPCSRASTASRSRNASGATAPVGLFGVLSQTSAVRSQTSSATASSVGEEAVLLEERQLDDARAARTPRRGRGRDSRAR